MAYSEQDDKIYGAIITPGYELVTLNPNLSDYTKKNIIRLLNHGQTAIDLCGRVSDDDSIANVAKVVSEMKALYRSLYQ